MILEKPTKINQKLKYTYWKFSGRNEANGHEEDGEREQKNDRPEPQPNFTKKNSRVLTSRSSGLNNRIETAVKGNQSSSEEVVIHKRPVCRTNATDWTRVNCSNEFPTSDRTVPKNNRNIKALPQMVVSPSNYINTFQINPPKPNYISTYSYSDISTSSSTDSPSTASNGSNGSSVEAGRRIVENFCDVSISGDTISSEECGTNLDRIEEETPPNEHFNTGLFFRALKAMQSDLMLDVEKKFNKLTEDCKKNHEDIIHRLEKIDARLKTIAPAELECEKDNRPDFFFVGSSFMRKLWAKDIVNGEAKVFSAEGQEQINHFLFELTTLSKVLIVQMDINDIIKADDPFKVATLYCDSLKRIKHKHKNTEIYVSGLPPGLQHGVEDKVIILRCNSMTKELCQNSQMHFIDNEKIFRPENSDEDTGTFIEANTRGKLNLTRFGVLRLLVNVKKYLPALEVNPNCYSELENKD